MVSRALESAAPKPLVFFDDPQAGLAVPSSSVFTSIASWRRAKQVPYLSVFRGVHPNELARLACEVQDVTLVLDEIDRACTDKRWHVDKSLATDVCKDGAWVRRVVHEGRHYRVGLWGSCRRFADVPEDLISQTDVTFLFRVDEHAYYDLKALERRYGPQASQAAPALEHGEFLAFGEV